MTDEEKKLNEGVFLTAGWLEDFLDEIEKQEHIVSMNSNYPSWIAEGMKKGLELIKNHI